MAASLKAHELGLLTYVLSSVVGPGVSLIVAEYAHTPDIMDHVATLREPFEARTEF
jgi:hypothetical protein